MFTLSPLIISILALTFAISAGLLNLYLVLMVFWIRSHERKHELSLIYYRFFVDFIYDFASSVNLGNMVRNLVLSENGLLQYESLIFLTAWPNFNLGSTRVLLVFFITLERVLAACIPINYHNYRSKITNPHIFLLIITYLLIDNTVIFYLCDWWLFNDPVDCAHFGCTVIKCYSYKWLVTEVVMYLVIGSLTMILCIRLFIWNHCTKGPKNGNLTRANRIALLDVFIIFSFDLIPSLLFSNYSSNFNIISLGPLMFLTKNIGFVTESLVVCNVLLWRKRKQHGPNHSTIVMSN